MTKKATIDQNSGIPLYRQIVNILREEIVTGSVDANEPMTEAKLEARFGVSLAPIKQALKELTVEGVIVRKKGKGTYPAPRSSVDRPADLKSGDLYQYLAQRGLNPTSEVANIERVAPPSAIASRLGLVAGEQALHFNRVIKVGTHPFAINDIYIAAPASFSPTATELRDGGSALALLRERSGIVLSSSEHEAWACAATAEQGNALGLEEGSPVLVIDTVFYATDGTAVGWRSAVHRPEEFKFHFVTKE